MSKNTGGRPPRTLSESVIRNAMKATQSNFQAARYLNMTIETYRKYAKLYIDQETGKTLYDLHKNNSGKGIKKISWKNEISLQKIEEILGRDSYRAVDAQKLKDRLLYENKLNAECYKCGHHEKRIVDYKQPLLLNFKDGNRNNWKHDNLEMLCYNCYFLLVGNLFSDKQIKKLEDISAPAIKVDEVDWSIDDNFLAHFRDLGLEESDDYKEGDEFVSRI